MYGLSRIFSVSSQVTCARRVSTRTGNRKEGSATRPYCITYYRREHESTRRMPLAVLKTTTEVHLALLLSSGGRGKFLGCEENFFRYCSFPQGNHVKTPQKRRAQRAEEKNGPLFSRKKRGRGECINYSGTLISTLRSGVSTPGRARRDEACRAAGDCLRP